MTILQVHRYKRLLQVLLLAFVAVFIGQLLVVRNSGPLSPSPLQLGLFSLAPLGISATFLLLWHMSWFGSATTHGRHLLRKLFFWLVAAGVVLFWFAFLATFVVHAGATAA
jgi:hypothetical protein